MEIVKMALLRQGAHYSTGPERCLGLLVSAMLTGALAACATSDVKGPLTPPTAANNTKGYLYGRFNLYGDLGMQLWIRLENVGNKHTFKMPFQNIGAPPYAIEVEPGTYRMQEFARAKGQFNTILEMMTTEMELENVAIPAQLSFISRPVSVQAGKGYYLGDFVALSERTSLTVIPIPFSAIVIDTHSGVFEYRPNFDATSKWLKERYPSLANVDLQPAFGKSE